MIEYRTLRVDDASRLGDIDRSEHVDGVYRVVDGALRLSPASEDAPNWSDAHRAAYSERLRALLRAGGHVVGAWEHDRLVAFASLVRGGVGGDATLLQLDLLYVSREHRGRGVGTELTRRVAVIARSWGASALYISATPTRGTVDAYVCMGASLLATPDPVLFAREPRDIHLVLGTDL